MKAFIIFVLVLGALITGGLGWYAWGKLQKNDPRGVGLELAKEFTPEEIELLLARYNGILDREEVLMPTIKAHNLAEYYDVASPEAALEPFRKDSYVELPDAKKIHILFTGKRITRDVREAASRMLAESFVDAAKAVGM